MRWRGRTAFVWCTTGAAALALGVLDASCRDPTEVILRVTTTESCGNFQGVAITVGPNVATTEANFEQHFVSATSTTCDPTSDPTTSLVGTLVLTPGNSTGSVLVAGGVRKPDGTLQDPSQCGGGTPIVEEGGISTDANSQYCIIARRSFAFTDHVPLTLPVNLDPLCIGRDCDPGDTCYKGACVSDNVVCSGSDCGLSVENPGKNSGENDASDGNTDGAITDAANDSSVRDASGATDGAMNIDASSDAGSDAPTDAPTDASSIPPCENISDEMGIYSATCNGTDGHGVIDPTTSSCECACYIDGTSEHYLSCVIVTAQMCNGSCNTVVASPP